MVRVVPTGYDYILGGSRNCLKEGGGDECSLSSLLLSTIRSGKEGL